MTHLIAERFVKPTGFSFGKNRLREFLSKPVTAVFLSTGTDSNLLNLTQIRPSDDIQKLTYSEMLVRVGKANIETTLVFPEVYDKNSQPLDLAISATWALRDARLFLREYALSRLAAQDVISKTVFEAFLTQKLSDWVGDEIRKETYEALKVDNVNATRFWQEMMPRWLGLKWLNLMDVHKVSYTSPLSERLMESSKQKELLEVEQQSIRQKKRADIQHQLEDAEHQQVLLSLKKDTELSNTQYLQQAEIAALEHNIRAISAEESALIAKLEGEKRRVEIETEIAEIQQNKSEAQALVKANEEAAAQASETLKQLQTAQNEIVESVLVLKKTIDQGIEDGKRLADHAAGLSESTVSLIENSSQRQRLVAIAREKAKSSIGEVSLVMKDLVSRDMASQKVGCLRIGTSLEFMFRTTRIGYVSILNIGTSGTVYLLTPSGLVGPESTQTTAPALYIFPGPPFYPVEDLWENGPAGWEDMLVVVSDEPLFSQSDLAAATPQQPEVVLTDPMIEALSNRLLELDTSSWAAGFLGFMVVH